MGSGREGVDGGDAGTSASDYLQFGKMMGETPKQVLKAAAAKGVALDAEGATLIKKYVVVREVA